MEKVLLAIDGPKPNEKAFRYAVQLCRRIRAELNILQIIYPKRFQEYIKKFRVRTDRTRRYLENSFTAAAFAEAGEHEMADSMMAEAYRNLKRLLPESERAGISCHLTLKTGQPKIEIVKYLNEHRNVVLTIYDTTREKNAPPRKNKSIPLEIRQALTVPLVVIES